MATMNANSIEYVLWGLPKGSDDALDEQVLTSTVDKARIKPETGTGGYDVEVYIGGVYDWNESQNFDTKQEAAAFAAKQSSRPVSPLSRPSNASPYCHERCGIRRRVVRLTHT